MNQNAPKRRKTQAWLLGALFFTPLLFAFLLYYGGGWRPHGTTNYGQLVTPARPIPAVNLSIAGGEQSTTRLLHGKWTLLYVGQGACNVDCQRSLAQIRQVRLALGDDMIRVQRLFVNTGTCCEGEYLEHEHPGLVFAHVDSTAAAPLLETIRIDSNPVLTADRTYLIDPLGNFMMSYASNAPGKGMLEDLKKLLKLSSIG
jgi:cytochrome oxidase Cu insertion factor (SCO1/SenC/PrrC family)